MQRTTIGPSTTALEPDFGKVLTLASLFFMLKQGASVKTPRRGIPGH
jgi:hypothetical protein